MNNFVSPAVQAMNLIREIGDKVSQSGEPNVSVALIAIFGFASAVSVAKAMGIIVEFSA